MSRRHRAQIRETQPDPKYGSVDIEKFIAKVMIDGKKSTARKIVYDAIEGFSKRVNEDPAVAFGKALENAMPLIEVKSRRIGGATYQVPMEILPNRKRSLGMKWIIFHSRNKSGKNMTEGLMQELQDCYNNQGATIKKRDDVHRMAEANKAFAHYKW